MTRALLGLLALDLATALAGYAALYRLGLGGRRWSSLRSLGLAYLTGWALLGSLLTFLLLVGVGPGVPAVLLTTAVLLAAALLTPGRAPALDDPARVKTPSRPGRALAGLSGAVLAAAALAAVVVAARGQWAPWADWDATWFWLPKAETIYYGHGLDAARWAMLQHQEYPPLLPTMYAAAFAFMGGFHPSLLPLQETLLGVAFLLSALTLLDRRVARWISLSSLGLLATTSWFWTQLGSLMADQPLAYLIAAAALAALLWLEERRGAWLALAVVFMAAATLTKVEGFFLSGLLVAMVASAGLIVHRRAALPVLWLALAPAAAAPWHLWLSLNGLRTSDRDYQPSELLHPGFLAGRFDRFSYAIDSMWSLLFVTRQTKLIVGFTALVLVLAAWRHRPAAAAVAGWLGLAFLGLATVYWIGRPALDSYVETTVQRVESTIIIVAATLTPLLLGLTLAKGAASEDMAEPS